MKTLNLYIDFEFTSLSPDAQPISLGIVSDICFESTIVKNIPDPNTGEKWDATVFTPSSKSFYAEFNDFYLNRCDDWVKENVIKKLKYNKSEIAFNRDELKNGNVHVKDIAMGIKQHLKGWLKHFSGYQIQFVVDCGTWDWYWMLQLLAEWDKSPKEIDLGGGLKRYFFMPFGKDSYSIGLPKLPANISPVPLDLNDLIAHKKGISVKEAFDLNREELAFGKVAADSTDDKHNAIWDAKVIKEVYNKLNKQP